MRISSVRTSIFLALFLTGLAGVVLLSVVGLLTLREIVASHAQQPALDVGDLGAHHSWLLMRWKAVCCGAALLALGISWVLGRALTRRVTRPLLGLAGALGELRSDKLGLRLPVDPDGETGQLAQAFNDMTSRIQESYSRLERLALGREEDLTRRGYEYRALHQEAQAANRRTTGLLDLSVAVSSTVKIDVTLQTVAEGARRMVDADYAEIQLDPSNPPTPTSTDQVMATSESRTPIAGESSQVYWAGVDAESYPAKASLHLEVFRSKRPVRVDELKEHPLAKTLPDGQGSVGPLLGVPIFVQRQVVAGLIVTRVSGRTPFVDADERSLVTIAHQLGLAIQNAKLLDRMRMTHVAEQSALLNLSQKLVTALDPKVMLESAFEIIEEIVPADGPRMMFLVDEDRQQLRCVASRRWSADADAYHLSLTDVGEPSMAEFRARRSVLVRDVLALDIAAGIPEFLKVQGVRGLIMTPLVASDELLGIMVTESLRPNRFTAESVRLMTMVANQLAIGIHNARAHQEVQRRAEKLAGEIAIQKLYAENVLASIADGVYTVDEENRVVSWNLGATAIVGYPAEEVIGRPCAEFFKHVDSKGDHLCYTDHCPFTAVRQTGQPRRQGEMFGFHRDGHKVALSVSTAPLFDAAGRFGGAVEVFRDVSRERQLMNDLARASEAKSTFLAGMSHELRTPLNAIIGFSQVLLKPRTGKLTEAQASHVTDILQSGQHLLSLINDILDLAKVESGKIDFDPSRCSLPELVSRSLAMVTHKAVNHRIELSTKLDEGPEYIVADERKVRQILLNLLSNALKFTPDGGRVTVTARFIAPPEPVRGVPQPAGPGECRWVAVSVSDTGVGIKNEDFRRIFEPFEQVENQYTRRAGGTGLGLALTRQFVELHGGRIWVESEEGKGSCFTFTLPPARSDSGQEAGA
ncbi:MAG: GAF domain-containing protein [Candidatus Riflebacteria bacterium]|nr:GAF domain-containing protein [Candidatus Riflebacteria bacterium]